jgi:hypothetical protein
MSENTIDPAQAPEDADELEPGDAEGMRDDQERDQRDRELTDEEDQ